MPKLGEYRWLLDTAFFLYPSKEHAVLGTQTGGTGFLIALPSTRNPTGYHHVYAVTNWHVAINGNCPVIRVNSRTGPPEIFDLKSSDWISVSGGYDVAVTQLALSEERHKVEALHVDWLLNEADIVDQEIDAGEDVFMLGRFVDFDGVEVNQPSLRFGHMSILSAPVEQPTGSKRPSHVIDIHSRSGYSGSPVFWYRTSGSIFAKKDTIMGGGHSLKLLGVHWGQFPERWEIESGEDVSELQDASVIRQGAYIKGLSGMTCVCPASAIREVLNLPELVAFREGVERHLK